jgi:DNA-binding transcriptional MerR regulator
LQFKPFKRVQLVMKYNPSDAAKACNVSVNTVRGWIRDFGEHFTPGARGESGNRLLSDKDMNTLQYIAALRSEGLQRDAIAPRLQEVEIGEAETIEPLQEASIAIASPISPDVRHATPALTVALDDLEKRIDAKFEALQQARQADEQRRRDPLQTFVLGFLTACALFLMLLLLAVLYGGFR